MRGLDCCWVELDRNVAEMGAVVSEARASGRVLLSAYSVAVKIDGARDELLWKLKDSHHVARGLEQQISMGVERLLAR